MVRLGWWGADDSYQSLGPLSLEKAITALNPITISWFYRPVFCIWAETWNTLAPHNPLPPHIAATILVGCTAFLLANWVRQVVENVAPAVLAVVLFLLAQTYDEAIGWFCCQSVVLAGFFGLLSLNFWPRYRVASVACFAVAILSKEDALAIPFLVVGLGIVKHVRVERHQLAYYACFFAILAIYVICDKIAIAHADPRHFVFTATQHHWRTTAKFLSDRLLFPFWPDPITSLTSVWATVGIALFAWRIRHRGTTVLFAVGVLVTASALVWASGVHVFTGGDSLVSAADPNAQSGGRFAYMPCLLAGALWGSLLWYGWSSSRASTRLCAALLGGYALIPVPTLDPGLLPGMLGLDPNPAIVLGPVAALSAMCFAATRRGAVALFDATAAAVLFVLSLPLSVATAGLLAWRAYVPAPSRGSK